MSKLSALYRTRNGKLEKRNSWAENNPEKKKELSRLNYIKNGEKKRLKTNKLNKELRELSKEIGNCVKCFKPKPQSKYLICLGCRRYMRRYLKTWRKK